jgi:SAM-dependent methyltransferase
MALEIARVLPSGSRVLDVGCGNGYIAHHLSAMVNASVMGIDLGESTEAPIDYRRFNGTRFPVESNSFDGVLLCYVLHHAQKLDVVLDELSRVLRAGGRAVIYEDIPATWWDRFVCSIHDRKWRNRTGPCSFYTEHEWSAKFEAADFEIVSQRRLSRLRNVSHPVSRNLYVLRLTRLTRDGSNGQRDGVVPGINDLAVPDSPDADSGERHGRIGCDAQMIACGRSTKIHERTLRAFRVRSCD